MLPAGETAIAGGRISQAATLGAMDIVLLPGSQLLNPDALDMLRRRFAARGLYVGQLRFARTDEEIDGA